MQATKHACWLGSAFMLALAWAGPTEQSSGFRELFAQYRGTGAESAVDSFADWTEARIAVEVPLAVDREDPWSMAALGLFHLEADLRRMTVQRDLPSDGSTELRDVRQPIHSARGQAILEKDVIPAARRTADRELLAFCRNWYIVLATAHSGARLSGYPRLVESAERHLGDDPEIQLLYGVNRERFMGPYEQGDSPYAFGDLGAAGSKGQIISVGGRNYHTGRGREAETAFRRALTLAPSLVEARLRLGHVYQLLGRRRDAQVEFERSMTDAPASGDRITGYLAALLLGRLREEAGQLGEAIEIYNTAIRAYPAGTAARIALGDALVIDGQADEGRATMRTVFDGDAGRALRDPWALYGAIGYWQLGSRLAAMRGRVSMTPLGIVSPVLTRNLESVPRNTGVPAAQPVSQPQFHGGVEGIRVEVLAADGDRVLSDLAASDFVVTDNGVRQAVARLTTAGSVSLALVLDASDSMSSAAGLAHLRTATAAVERALGAGDLVSVVTAADRVRLWADRLPGAERLSSVLGLAQPVRNSFTALWDAVLAGNSLVADAPGRAAVLVVSDGADNASWFSRAPAINRLKRRGTPVDGIHVPWVERDAVDIAYGDINLREPALATGGVHFGVTDPALGKKLSDRFAALRQSYLLFYTPTNVRPQKDGWHEIKVSLRPGVKGKVQARPGYYAPVKK